MDLLSQLVTPTETKGCARHVALRPGTKGHPLLSRPGVPGWETGTTEISQLEQINISIVVNIYTVETCHGHYQLRLS